MFGVLENGAGLRPGQERVVGRQHEPGVGRLDRHESTRSRGRHRVLAGLHCVARCLRAAHPLHAIGLQLGNEVNAVLLDDLVEHVEHGIIVMRIGNDDLVLELRLQEVGIVARCIGRRHHVLVVAVGKGKHEQSGEAALRILVGIGHLVPADRLVGQQQAALCPVVKIMQRLQMGDVDFQILAKKLFFDAGVVVLAEVDHDVDLHARKLALEAALDAKALRHLVTAGIHGQLPALLECCLVQVLQRLAGAIALHGRGGCSRRSGRRSTLLRLHPRRQHGERKDRDRQQFQRHQRL
ncbi:hypothetical protein D3C71_1148930 [compost metagenome]